MGIQKDVQNCKKCNRKMQRELNCSAQENRRVLLFFTLEIVTAEDVENRRENRPREKVKHQKDLRTGMPKFIFTFAPPCCETFLPSVKSAVHTKPATTQQGFS